MESESLRIRVPHVGADRVAARLDRPEEAEPRAALLLAHGAGTALDSPFLEALAVGLAGRGLAVLRFNYVYSELAARSGKRRPPDRRSVLLDTHRAALATLREHYPASRILLGGKSMGGRMASYLAAEGEACAGLVFFGYPLHPPGKPEKLRSEHFAAIAQPALFLQGTRDALCELELLRRELEMFGGTCQIEVIEEADHDFRVPRSIARWREEILEELVQRVDAWERRTWPE